MKANHRPVKERLRARIQGIQARVDAAHVPSHSKGNPYWMCKHCQIHDPCLSIEGDHYVGCPLRGSKKEIAYYQSLLSEV